MVFTSLPSYLDPPQWHQQPNHQLGITTTTSTNENHPQLQLPPPVTVPQSSTGSIRPNSMTDRARLAKIPQPESALKCPRCESTNTKFCYFNNYSLTQPRHFCKTCRRYWTRGGALRSVPVGGGCRRNKRSKGSSSKSSGNANHKGGGGTSNSATSTSTNTTNSLSSNVFTSDIVSNFASPLLPQLNFMNSLQHLHGYGDHMGLSFSATQQPLLQGTSMEFQMGTSTTTSGVGVGGGVDGSNILSDQWRLQQFPFLGGATYSLEGDMVSPTYSKTTPVVVKMEDNQGYNSTRQFLGIHGNDQYWGGIHGLSGGVGGSGSGGDNAWTDLPSFTSSTTISHHLS